LKTIFKLPNINIDVDENSLVIHIRSGDIFNTIPHPNYIVPPLMFYTKIIDSNIYKKIYIIAEDMKNPCIEELLRKYDNIIFKKQTLEEDINMILQASSIVISCGSFVQSLLLMSTKIKRLYLPSYSYISNIHVEKNIIPLTKYIKIMTPWKNTDEQREIILTYDLDNENTLS
jgi:hypothetical protein